VVETEPVQTTVATRREEARIEREPITDANVDSALDGPEISEEEHEVVLHEEEPVVEKRAVPKERVRLSKDTHTDETEVSEQVRKERIDSDHR
jgi:stress response protein YsnF